MYIPSFLSAAIVLIGGCSAHPGPIVDTKGVSMAAYHEDLSECKDYAAQIRTVEGVAKGTATGAAIGSAVGAVFGIAGEGAATGAVQGGTESAILNEDKKQLVVKRCMVGRGYRVLN